MDLNQICLSCEPLVPSTLELHGLFDPGNDRGGRANPWPYTASEPLNRNLSFDLTKRNVKIMFKYVPRYNKLSILQSLYDYSLQLYLESY